MIGVLAGVNSNVNQYLISEAGSEAPDFSNGLYLTAANLGTTFGTFFCGFFITEMGTQYSLFGTLIFVVLGLVSIVLRMYLQKVQVSKVDLKG